MTLAHAKAVRSLSNVAVSNRIAKKSRPHGRLFCIRFQYLEVGKTLLDWILALTTNKLRNHNESKSD